jgi:hypothetical protein
MLKLRAITQKDTTVQVILPYNITFEISSKRLDGLAPYFRAIGYQDIEPAFNAHMEDYQIISSILLEMY